MFSSQSFTPQHVPVRPQQVFDDSRTFEESSNISRSMQNMSGVRSPLFAHSYRQLSDPIIIRHSGYLLKRSNKPYQDPPAAQQTSFSSTVNTSTTISRREIEMGNHLPLHVNVSSGPVIQNATPSPTKAPMEDHQGPDTAISMASAFFGCANTPEPKKVIQKCEYKNSSIKLNLLKENDSPNFSTNEDICKNKEVSGALSPQSTSKKIDIPKHKNSLFSEISQIPQSYTIDPNNYTSSSSPAICEMDANTSETKTPLDIIDPNDGHIWRAKYCILENGILYFYGSETDANTPKAKCERTEYSSINRSQTQSPAHSSFQQKGFTDTLSTSPIPRPTMECKSNPLLIDSDVMWEKRVALECVGAVRSAEDEHGQFSFVLLTSAECNALEEQDCLVLRSNSTEEMQEWLFQIHRSLALIVKEMVFHHPTGSTLLPPEVHQPLVGVVPRYMASDKRVALNNQASISYSPKLLQGSMSFLHSLSHGHGRNDMHRRRIRDKISGVPRSRTSSFGSSSDTRTDACSTWDNEEPFDLVDDIIHSKGSESKKFLFASDINSEDNEKEKNPLAQPSKITNNIHSMKATDDSIKVKKYIPPHLKRKQNAKYVPPHLRNKQLNPSLTPNITDVEDYCTTRDEKKENVFITADLDGMHAENATDNTLNVSKKMSIANKKLRVRSFQSESSTSQHFKLGGCADKVIGSGSIMDSVYKKRSIKLGKGRTDTYGFTRNNSHLYSSDNKSIVGTKEQTPLNWEVGAVSACGVRSSNEDAYLIANDLMHVLERQTKNGDDYRIQECEGGSSRGLFAVFDGHCGFQTARFAAEKFTTFLLQSMKNHPAMEEDTKLEDFFLNEDQVIQGLHSAITALDDDFCTRSTTDGREWGDCGATALVSVLSHETLYVANLGDCRGILCGSCFVDGSEHDQPLSEGDGWSMLEEEEKKDGLYSKNRTFWKEVTDIHNPSRQDEKERIEAANGWTTTEQEICFGQIQRMDLEDKDALDILKRWFSHRFKEFDEDHPEEVEFSSSDRAELKKKKFKAAPGRLLKIHRICGELGVSRALGDKDFKSAFNYPPESSVVQQNVDIDNRDWWEGPNYLPYPKSHNGCFRGDLVSSTPEFQVLKIGNKGVMNEFLILACDGLWDVMDPDDAARIARDLMFGKGWSAESSAARLAELAIHLGSSDNITVILLRFFRND